MFMAVVILIDSGVLRSAWNRCAHWLNERSMGKVSQNNMVRDLEHSLVTPLLDDENCSTDPDVAAEKAAVLNGLRKDCSV